MPLYLGSERKSKINLKRVYNGDIDVSHVTATASDVLSPKVIVDSNGTEITGTIETKTSSNLTASGATVNVPAGYYADNVSKSVATATQATPSISVSSDGVITATSSQSAGYVESGTKSSTYNMNTQSATTYTPTTSNQTIESGTYLTGVQTIAGDSNLISSNIKSGTSIFGVSGSYTGSGSGGVDTSDATVESADVLYGKVFYGADGKATGTMPDNSGLVEEITVNGTYRLPDGYHHGSEVRVSVPSSSSGGTDTSDATAVSADVRDGVTFYNANGKQTGSMPDAVISDAVIIYDSNYKADISAHVSTGGYIEQGAYVLPEQIDAIPDDIKIKMFETSDFTYQTKNSYMFGNVVVSVDNTNITPENIKNGVNILGTTGTYGSDFATNIDKISVTVNSYSNELSITAKRSDIPTAIIIKNNTIPTGIANSEYTVLLSAMYDITADEYYEELPSVYVSGVQKGTRIRFASSYWSSVHEYTADTSQMFVVIPSSFSTDKIITIDYEAEVGGHTFGTEYSHFWGNYDVYLIYD